MFLISNLRPGGMYGIPTHESRDPIGCLVAGLGKLASSDLIDRVGLRRQTEQMLVDLVGEFATEVVRPAASAADAACRAPDELLEAAVEIGLPILGLPESLGGVSEERSAMAGTLVSTTSPSTSTPRSSTCSRR